MPCKEEVDSISKGKMPSFPQGAASLALGYGEALGLQPAKIINK
jgi:hypothetical protein